jgi:hypothetical protein
MRRHHAVAIEPRPYVVARYNSEIARKMPGTVWTMGGCSSWYLDAEGRNTTLWPDFTWRYRRLMRRFEPTDYLIETERASEKERVPA